MFSVEEKIDLSAVWWITIKYAISRILGHTGTKIRHTPIAKIMAYPIVAEKKASL